MKTSTKRGREAEGDGAGGDEPGAKRTPSTAHRFRVRGCVPACSADFSVGCTWSGCCLLHVPVQLVIPGCAPGPSDSPPLAPYLPPPQGAQAAMVAAAPGGSPFPARSPLASHPLVNIATAGAPSHPLPTVPQRYQVWLGFCSGFKGLFTHKSAAAGAAIRNYCSATTGSPLGHPLPFILHQPSASRPSCLPSPPRQATSEAMAAAGHLSAPGSALRQRNGLSINSHPLATLAAAKMSAPASQPAPAAAAAAAPAVGGRVTPGPAGMAPQAAAVGGSEGHDYVMEF